MRRDRRFWIVLYQYAAGLCDAGTGLFLLLAPAWTLGLMGIKVIPHPIVFVSYIGVFVLSVGLTYLWVAVTAAAGAGSAPRWQTQWFITALFRTLVALFIVAEIATGRLESAWAGVALTDGTFAMIQWIGLRRGWLNFGK
ncbi:hypothetical protein [Acidipila rosea]|uniref:Uncharacterized protein n=1 Tax=Acidipila rosea TaxID=768535 RepID=A0A4R1L8T4_9BACT|nr:hypothetical protein [Acidipila rosea]MBW4026728.1 hypothetical protein [Acidobacteriota bacterium]MBW4044905.1 hypothetical protein [Acidobacteriota bacterium]TCK73610.1 hypothetical protein C7378_1223 [Acidipila rosea]